MAEAAATRDRAPAALTIGWNAAPARWRHVILDSTAAELASLSLGGIGRILRVRVPEQTPLPLVQRILSADTVASAFIEVVRPRSALRRRPWRWPLRVATLGMSRDAAAALQWDIAGRYHFPPELLDVRRAESDPEAVDLLVLQGPLDTAIDAVVRKNGPVANAVAVFGVDHGWHIDTALLDELRAITGAVVVALDPSTDMAGVIDGLVTEMSHSLPFDVAYNLVSERRALLVGEGPGLDRAQLPLLARRMARQVVISRDCSTSAEPPLLPSAEDMLEAMADGEFHHERDEATGVAEAAAHVEDEMARAEQQERWLQATVGRADASPPDQILRRGRNRVNVFIGPREESAAAAPTAFPDAELPWDEEDPEAFRLTIGFVPLHPPGPAQVAELDLPRVGASEPVSFRWGVRRGKGEADPVVSASARILVLFRNRVLQTAVLAGNVNERVRLEEAVALRPDLGGLDDRQPFDVAFFANHDGRDVATLIRASKNHLSFDEMKGLPAITGQLSAILAAAVEMTQTKKGLRTEAARNLLVQLAVKGRDLHDELEQLGPLDAVNRLQMVSARSSWYLPVELVYTRWAPRKTAAVCESFLGGQKQCDGSCPRPTDRSVVCPNAFWGLQKTIERIQYDPILHAGMEREHLMLVAPRAKDRRLSVERTAVGASARVRPVDVDALMTALGAGTVRALGWEQWAEKISTADFDLLVLLPHTEYSATESIMEIDKTRLERGEMETDVVRRSDKVRPTVILFGCRTSGTADDPTGFANRFMQKGAAVVFGSLTMLLGRHAAALAQRLAARMRAGVVDHLPVGEVLADFRREAVREGLLAALAVTAYGDADWTV